MLSETGSPSFVSYANHMAHMRAALFGRLNTQAMAQGIDPVMEFRGDIHEFFDRWIADAPPMRHVAAWWDLRGEPNVLFVHYNDPKADLDREMRRVAAFPNIGIPAARWPVVVDGCTFESMRADADKVGNFERAFEGGAKSFLFKGVNGRWREVLTEGELRRYRHRVEELLAPEAARWLEHGSLLAGSRP